VKAWLFVLIGVGALALLVVSYQVFQPALKVDYTPKRPPNLPEEAVWAGGADGGAWFVILPQQQRIDVWSVKIYTDNGEPWVRGDFWLKDAEKVKRPIPIAFFDGRNIFLVGGAKMLPVGEHHYAVAGHDTIIKVYPPPGADYAPEPLNEKSVKEETW
jgi:hypothetical protein